MSRISFAKRSISAAALLLTTLAPALASSHYETMYRDTIRPHGQPRSQRVYDAALDYCYGETGLSRNAADTDAFKACMKGRGYLWKWTKDVPDSPRTSRAARQNDDTYISSDTGNVCHSYGIVGICTPPNGTVNYTNDEGLHCTRTGLMSVCSNF